MEYRGIITAVYVNNNVASVGIKGDKDSYEQFGGNLKLPSYPAIEVGQKVVVVVEKAE